VTANYHGQAYDAMVRAVSVTVNEQGLETIDARLEGTE
jgi:hypothetical protein